MQELNGKQTQRQIQRPGREERESNEGKGEIKRRNKRGTETKIVLICLFGISIVWVICLFVQCHPLQWACPTFNDPLLCFACDVLFVCFFFICDFLI